MDEPFAALDEITRFKLNDDLLSAVADARQDRGVRHPFGVRIGLPLAAHRGDDGRGPAASSPSCRSMRPIRATRKLPHLRRICRLLPQGLGSAGARHDGRSRVMSDPRHAAPEGTSALTQRLCACCCRSLALALELACGTWWCASTAIPPYVLPGPGLVLATLVVRLGMLSVLAARDAHHHDRRLAARGRRRRRPCGTVQPVAPGRTFALSLRGDPAGDADRGDRAAAADLSAAAGRGAGLRLDRRVLSGPRQHHARPELGRS